jgi:hypothetical protein
MGTRCGASVFRPWAEYLLSVKFLPERVTLHVPTVPIRDKAPVAGPMLYIDTLFEAEFVT